MDKIKLLVLIPSLNGGGAERVVTNLLNSFDRNKFKIYLGLINIKGKYNNLLKDDVEIIDLKSKRTLYSGIKILKTIKSIKPNIIFSAASHLNIYLMLLRPFISKKVKIMIRESSIVSEKINNQNILYRNIYNKCYNKSNLVICQSKYMADDLVENFQVNPQKIKIIYNPVNIEHIQHASETNNNSNPYKTIGLNILTVGRLEKIKNHEYLIKNFKEFVSTNRNAYLYILGEGSLKEDLIKLVLSLGIEENVFFLGFKENPYVWMKNADLFILPSKFEGMPNALLEAIACETPVIVTDHPGGTREVMEVTNQLERVVENINFEKWWFNTPHSSTFIQLNKNFHIKSITKKYEAEIIRMVGLNEEN